MKKIYFWIVTLLAFAGAFSASAQNENPNVKFSVIVPDAKAISCMVNNEVYPLQDGKNDFDVPQYNTYVFTAVSPYKITSITNQHGTSVSGFWGDTWYLTANTFIEGDVYTITVVNPDETRTDSFTLNIDDPSMVTVLLQGYNTYLNDLHEGENIIKYDPAVETRLTIKSTNYMTPVLYSVTVDGADVEPIYNEYTVDLVPDCVVNVVAKLPDEDRTVTFTYSEGAEDCISGVYINNVKVEDFNGKTVTAKIGSNIMISFDMGSYKLKSVAINGVVETNVYGSKGFTLVKDTKVDIEAEPYGTVAFTLTINNPDLVKVYQGYMEKLIVLSEGENTVEVSENNRVISWVVNAGAYIESVTYNGTLLESQIVNLNNIQAGDIVEMDVRPIIYDKEAAVWIDTDGVAEEIANYNFSLSSNFQRFDFDVRTGGAGYKIVDFLDKMNPFTMTWFGTSNDYTFHVYLDDEALNPVYEGSHYFSFSLEDKSVLKVFLNSEPVECNVSFEIAENVTPVIYRDVIVEVEDAASGFKCFAGTQVNISGEGLKISLNGEELPEARANDYTLTVTDPETVIKVESQVPSGVNEIAVESENDDVFNTLGLRVGKRSEVKDLTPGIYVVGGKKVIVK